jgi:hypothetical protein
MHVDDVKQTVVCCAQPPDAAQWDILPPNVFQPPGVIESEHHNHQPPGSSCSARMEKSESRFICLDVKAFLFICSVFGSSLLR